MVAITRNLMGIILFCFVSLVFAETVKHSPEELEQLSKKSIAKAVATSKTPPTPEMVMKQVQRAAKLIEKEGPAAFDKFRGDSDFIFDGTYVWIHDINGVMLVHPIKPKMEGNNLINLKDAKGKLIFAEINDNVQKNPKGETWIEYWWPKPGDVTPSKKASFAKKAVYGDKIYVIGCGVYDMDLSDIKK